MKTIAFKTLGCRLNLYETDAIASELAGKDYKVVEFGEKADVYVINTCSVTENADKRFKQVVRSALKQNEEAFLIAIGCYAQLKPKEIIDQNKIAL